jgi:hypothetical protein
MVRIDVLADNLPAVAWRHFKLENRRLFAWQLSDIHFLRDVNQIFRDVFNHFRDVFNQLFHRLVPPCRLAGLEAAEISLYVAIAHLVVVGLVGPNTTMAVSRPWRMITSG